MFIHNVYFWLKDDVKAEELQAFEHGLASLLSISDVQDGYWGKPAHSPRDVVDNSYSYALTAFFKDREGHDAYQVDEKHLEFLKQNSSLWFTVKVYDYLTEREL